MSTPGKLYLVSFAPFDTHRVQHLRTYLVWARDAGHAGQIAEAYHGRDALLALELSFETAKALLAESVFVVADPAFDFPGLS